MNSPNTRLSQAVLSRLTQFADELGWHGLERFTHTLAGHEPALVVWYEAGVRDGARAQCSLQINEHPMGSVGTYSAAIYSIRHRICSGCHRFECANLRQAFVEAVRLHDWLSHDWLTSLEKRRTYRRMHAECSNYSWKKLRERGEPHRV